MLMSRPGVKFSTFARLDLKVVRSPTLSCALTERCSIRKLSLVNGNVETFDDRYHPNLCLT